MGALDTDGTVNVYVEDSTFLNTGGGDLDNNSRVVARYNTFDGSVWTGHGFTSPTGSRHFESYNNTYNVSAALRNHGGRYVWIRAGTAIFTDNTVNGAAVPQNYGDPALLVIGEDGKPPTQNPQYRQPGWGHDGTRDLLDPIYIWGNAGARGSAAGVADDWAVNLQFDRELYLNRGAKPGYAKYTYPHPARVAVESLGPDTTPPVISNPLPTGEQPYGTASVTLQVATNEVATCRHHPSDVAYASMGSTFPTTGGSLHQQSGFAVQNGTSYTRYVRCADSLGNANTTSAVISFSVAGTQDATPPSVTITSPPGAVTINSPSLVLNGIATDNVGVVGCKWRRSVAPTASQGTACTWASGQFTCGPTTGYVSGANTVYVGCYDAMGNYGSASRSVTLQAPPALPTGNNGIAVAYPGDSGIAANPNVVFADGFESYSAASQLTSSGNWTNRYQAANVTITQTPGEVFWGTRALRMAMPVTASEIANGLVKALSGRHDTLHIRYYIKYAANFNIPGGAHNGASLKAGAYPGPGNIPDGTDFFTGLIQSAQLFASGETPPGYLHAYVYHPEGRHQWGDEWYPDGTILPYDQQPGDWGPYFTSRPRITLQRDRWYAVEVMLQANTPGQRNGRMAAWVDGALVADWQNIRFRDVAALQLQEIELMLHGQSNAEATSVWYDNVVLATSYIGPMASAGGDTTPPTPSVPRQIQGSGTALSFTLSEPVTVAGAAPTLTGCSGGATTLSGASGSGTSTLSYAISRQVLQSETGCVLGYTQPGDGIQDLAGNDMESFSGQAVTNGSTQQLVALSGLAPSTPQPKTATQVTLELTTDKAAMCRWGYQPGIAWGSLNQYDTTGGTEHAETLPVVAGGVYRVCARCLDTAAEQYTADACHAWSAAAEPKIDLMH